MATCGTGGWTGPLPGDPDNNVLLSATSIFGGVVVSWTFPTTYPHAVAHVLVYRGTSLNYATSIKIATTHSSQFFDENLGTTDIQYYYWIQLVSINGTVGDAIGPATALSRPSITTIIEQLTGKIEYGALSQALKQEIDRITLISQGLTTEELARIAANSALGALIAEMQTNTDSAIADLLAGILEQTDGLIQEALDRTAADIAEASSRIEAVTLESIARTAQVQETAYAALEATLAANGINAAVQGDIALARSELSEDLQAGLSAEAALRTILAAKLDTDIGTTLSAVTSEATARSTGDAAEATARDILSAQILGADGTSLTQGLIYQERTTRVTEDLALAQQITLLSAGAGEQFDWQTIWYFDSGIESWNGNGTPTAAAGWLRPANQASDAYVNSPVGIAADGAKYAQVRLRIRKTGSPTFAGWLYWQGTLDNTWDNSRRIALTEPTYDGNGIGLITVTPTWGSIFVNTIRVDLSSAQGVSDYYELDWVAVGRPSPGASSAQVYTEQTARAEADSALATNIITLSAQVNNVTNGLPATYATLITEQITRATADTANANSITVLSAQVNHVSTGLPATLAAISTEQTARANADTAIADSVTLLSSQVNNATTGLPQTRADLITTQNTIATATAASVSDIRSLKAQTNSISEAALRNLFVNSATREEFTGTLAIATQELHAEIVAGVSAESSARLALAAIVNSTAAGLVTEQTTRASETGALTTSLTNLTATVSGNSAAISNEQTARANADGAMATDILALVTATGNNAAAITATNAAWADADEAIALTVTNLSSTVSTNQATLVSTYYTKAAADSVIAYENQALKTAMEAPSGSIGLLDTALDALTVSVGAIGSDLITNYYTKTATDSTIAQAGTQLRSYADIGVKSFSQTTAPTKRGVNTTVIPNVDVALVAGDIWVDSDDNIRYRWNGTTWIVASDTSYTSAQITNLEQTKIGYATKAGLVFDNSGVIVDQAGVTAWNAAHPTDLATWHVGLPLATAVKQVSVTDPNTGTATVEQAFTAQKTLNDALKVQYTVKLSVNAANGDKMIGGFGVYGDVTGIEAGFDVDRFWIGRSVLDPGTGLFTKVRPFIIEGTDVIIDNAIIRNLSASHINSNGLTIRDNAGNIVLNAGSATFVGNVTGTVNGTAASTLVSTANTANSTANTALVNAATAQSTANTANGVANSAYSGLSSKFNNNAQNVLTGSGGISTGTLTWDTYGNRTGGYGLGFTRNGLVAYNSSGVTTFVLDGTSGAGYLRGLEIRNSSDQVVLNSGNTASQIFNSEVSLGVDNANGRIALNGAGGGEATGMIMPGYPINSSNVGTYIADLTVGTLKIGADAVTLVSAAGLSYLTGNGNWQSSGGVSFVNTVASSKAMVTFTGSVGYASGIKTTQYILEHYELEWIGLTPTFVQKANIYDSGEITGTYSVMPSGSIGIGGLSATTHAFVLKWWAQDSSVVLRTGNISVVGVKR